MQVGKGGASGIKNQDLGNGESVRGGAWSFTGSKNEFPLIRDCPGE